MQCYIEIDGLGINFETQHKNILGSISSNLIYALQSSVKFKLQINSLYLLYFSWVEVAKVFVFIPYPSVVDSFETYLPSLC